MMFHRILVAGLCLGVFPTLRAELLVSEVMPGTEHGYLDEDGARNDWIELFNAGDRVLELSLIHI